MSEYKFIRIDESRYSDMEKIHRATFKENPIKDYYRNKMDTSYLGVKHFGFLAYSQENEPVAFYGVYPYMMEYQGKQYLAAQSGDTMTHPDHGGKGLFTALAKMTYEQAKNEGIQFIFGFPNNNSYPGFVKKLNWTHKENMRDYKWRVLTLPFAGISKKLKFLMPLYKIYVNVVLSFYKTKNTFQPSSVINNQFGGVSRNEKSFRYKSFYNNRLVSIGGKCAWIKIDGALLIGDIEKGSPDEVNKIIHKLKRLAFWLGCNKIIFPVGRDTAWDILLRDKNKSDEGIYVGYLDLQSGLPLENFKYVFADFDTF